jgi:voltage-gated potassium channel
MSLLVMERAQRAPAGLGPDPDLSPISLPSRRSSPQRAVLARAAFAVFLLVLSTVIVYLGRDGYRDAAHPGQPLTLLASAYYSAVALSTTGYGDIVPVTAAARLVNTLVITPIRVIFLIVLIGTTLEVLTERTRRSWRISRWRSRVSGHTVVVGYGTKGRAALATLRETGTPAGSLVVVDRSPEAMDEANRAGLVGVTGDAARREVLANAQIGQAARVVIAVGRDDSAVLITLTARQLAPGLTITAAVRESENEPLLRQSGADQVVVSSEAAGRLLGLSTMDPAVGKFMGQLLDNGNGLNLCERACTGAEIGRPAAETAGAVAVLRAGRVLAVDDPRAGPLVDGDRLVLIARSSVVPGQAPEPDDRASRGDGPPSPSRT